MTNFADEVNSTGYEYRPYSQNSNSFAAEALKRAGFFGPGTAFPEIFDRLLAVDPVRGETHAVRVPGFDQRLKNPLNDPAAPLNRSAIPFVPVNEFAAGDRQNSFDHRFEGLDPSQAASVAPRPDLPAWMVNAGDTSRVADSKPIRYLSKRVVGGPEASAVDTGAPATQFVLPGELNSSGGPGDWAAALAGLSPPMQAAPPPQTGGTPESTSAKPVRYLSRRIADNPQASVFDTSAPAVPFVPAKEAVSLDRRDAFVSGSDPSSHAGDAGGASSTPGLLLSWSTFNI